jgi:glycosyltransferase involved in cell wall biosynthesis
MRVLVIHNRYRVRGGEDLVVDREIALLKSGGIEVDLLESDSRAIQGASAQLGSALRLAYSRSSRKDVGLRLEAFRPDVVHVHNFFPTFTPSVYDACQEFGVPVVQTLHNFRIYCVSALLARNGKPCELCLTGGAWQGVRYACYNNSRLQSAAMAWMVEYHRSRSTWNRKVDCFIALSHFSQRKFIEGGIDPAKIVLKPNFAHPALRAPSGHRERAALFVGRISEEKGVRTLIHSWRHMEHPLWIVGDGPLRTELEALGAANVRFLGVKTPEEVAGLMGRAAFLLLPSECYENFPLVIAEAYSQGLPVVSSGIGSLLEIVRDGETGLHFSPGDSSHLAERARMLFGDEALRLRLAEAARKEYLQHYTPSRNLEMLLNIYEKARIRA